MACCDDIRIPLCPLAFALRFHQGVERNFDLRLLFPNENSGKVIRGGPPSYFGLVILTTQDLARFSETTLLICSCGHWRRQK